MKTRQFLASLVAVTVMAGTSAFVSPVGPVKKAKAATYKVDTQKSILNWEGKKSNWSAQRHREIQYRHANS